MKIITGRTGELHVTSDDDRHLHAGAFGDGKYILNTGSRLNATNPSSNVIRLAKGDVMFQGLHARVEDYEDVELEPGTEGYSRIDVICCQYKKTGGVESTVLVVYTGTPALSNPTVPRPTYESNNILDGAEMADMPLYKIVIAGVNVASIERIATVRSGMDDIYRKNEVYSKPEVDDKFKNVYHKNETYSKNEVDEKNNEFEENNNHIRNGAEYGVEKCKSIYNDIGHYIDKINQGQTVDMKEILMLMQSLAQNVGDAFAAMSD